MARLVKCTSEACVNSCLGVPGIWLSCLNRIPACSWELAGSAFCFKLNIYKIILSFLPGQDLRLNSINSFEILKLVAFQIGLMQGYKTSEGGKPLTTSLCTASGLNAVFLPGLTSSPSPHCAHPCRQPHIQRYLEEGWLEMSSQTNYIQICTLTRHFILVFYYSKH